MIISSSGKRLLEIDLYKDIKIKYSKFLILNQHILGWSTDWNPIQNK